MNVMLKQALGVSILSVMMMGSTWAATEEPKVFVKRVADDLLKRLQEEKKKGTLNDPKVINSIVRQNLDPYLDAQGFANTVMGTYVKAEGVDAALRQKFTANLRETLIERYGTAFAKFSGQKYTIQNQSLSANKKTASVNISFVNKGDRIPVTFQLVDTNNNWKVRNIRVSGVDIALQFKNQFSSAVARNGGNVVKTVDTFTPNADNAIK